MVTKHQESDLVNQRKLGRYKIKGFYVGSWELQSCLSQRHQEGRKSGGLDGALGVEKGQEPRGQYKGKNRVHSGVEGPRTSGHNTVV